MFRSDLPLSGITPAAYNPRQITPEAFDRLKSSIISLGMIRPIIVTTSGQLIAGHQRTKAMAAVGLSTAPAQILADVSQEDEVRFNQLHNASDKEIAVADLRIGSQARTGWIEFDASKMQVVKRPAMASKLVEVVKLLAKHGPFSGAVALTDGRIVAGHLYAFACRLINRRLHIYIVDAARAADVERFLSQDYGEFSYGHLAKTTWAQSLAQMFRIRSGREARGKSRTYEEMVLPYLTRSMRVLDFGAGQMDYVRYLRRRRFDIIGVEFYRRKRASMHLDLKAVHEDIDRLSNDLRHRGLFDLVVCDSVLNSVDSSQAESDVLTTINALCRPGGTIVFSGRRMAFEHAIENNLSHSRSCLKRHVYFTDKDGFSAMYQRGVWLYQKFHSDQRVAELAAETIGPEIKMRCRGSAWAVRGVKSIVRSGAAESLAREFNLPLPDGTTYDRSDIVDAWKIAQTPRSSARAPYAARAPQKSIASRQRGSRARANLI